MNKIYSLTIICAGILWGTIGIFAKTLTQFGFDSVQNTTIRLAVCAIVLVLINIKHLRIKLSDLWMFALLGIASLFSMSFVYFEAIKYTSLSLAAILLYTAPIMVTIMASVFYREKMTTLKIAALIFAFIGIVMISGFDPATNITAKGIVYGLLSAFSYSLYSIIGKFVLKKYSTKTTITYAFIFAAAAAVLCCDFSSIASTVALADNKIVLAIVMFATGIVTAALPYTLYTIGLTHVPAGKASIMASVEPLTATLIGVAFYSEKLGIISLLGMALILGSVTSLSLSKA